MTKIDTKKKAVLQALKKSLGVVSDACDIAKISRQTYYNYLEDEEFAKQVEDVAEIAFDFVESKIYQQIAEDNTTMIIFYAKTKMKKRGYVERREITGKDGKPFRAQSIEEIDKLLKELREKTKSGEVTLRKVK